MRRRTVVRCYLKLGGLENIYGLPDDCVLYADHDELQLPDGHVALCKTTTGEQLYVINEHLERADV